MMMHGTKWSLLKYISVKYFPRELTAFTTCTLDMMAYVCFIVIRDLIKNNMSVKWSELDSVSARMILV